MDPYERIADFYDLEHAPFVADIEFYLQSLPPGTVLEVGTGTGRVAGALAAAGHQVHGVDPSDAMLRRARERWTSGGLTFSKGVLPNLDVKPEFDSVILSLNTLWHLSDLHQQTAALATLRNALKSGGLLFVDLTNPLTMADRGANGQVRERFRGPTGDCTLVVQSTAWDDAGSQMLELHLTYDRAWSDGRLQRALATLRLRYVYRWELELMLERAGLRVQEVFGSYDMDLYDGESPNILAVARNDVR